jgi:hypothetical protein
MDSIELPHLLSIFLLVNFSFSRFWSIPSRNAGKARTVERETRENEERDRQMCGTHPPHETKHHYILNTLDPINKGFNNKTEYNQVW